MQRSPLQPATKQPATLPPPLPQPATERPATLLLTLGSGAASQPSAAAPSGLLRATIRVGSMRCAPDGVFSEAARLHGVAPLPGATRFIRADRRTPLGNPLNPSLSHCGAQPFDCHSCASRRQRAVAGAARIFALADPAEPFEEARRLELRLCDNTAPCRSESKRHAALHTLAWRLALGENLVLLCWCAPKACHLAAVADNITNPPSSTRRRSNALAQTEPLASRRSVPQSSSSPTATQHVQKLRVGGSPCSGRSWRGASRGQRNRQK